MLETLKTDDPAHIKDSDVLNHILLDERNGNYPGGLDRDELARRGIQTIACRLVSMRSQPYIDENGLEIACKNDAVQEGGDPLKISSGSGELPPAG